MLQSAPRRSWDELVHERVPEGRGALPEVIAQLKREEPLQRV